MCESLELALYRKWLAHQSMPHICQRTVETHLGQQYAVARIEIRLGDDKFYHTATETRGIDNLEQLNRMCEKMINHINAGGLLNMDHWSRIEFKYSYLGI